MDIGCVFCYFYLIGWGSLFEFSTKKMISKIIYHLFETFSPDSIPKIVLLPFTAVDAILFLNFVHFIVFLFQINEDASDKVLELEQQFNEIRRPVYNKRTEVINSIPDFWLTAVCQLG